MLKAAAGRSIGTVGALALSLALIGPTLVLAANCQAIAGVANWPIWSIFAVGAVCVSMVAYSIGRLVAALSTGASAYHIASVTLGPWVGRAVGLILCGTYACFALATPSATAGFLADLTGNSDIQQPVDWSVAACGVSILATLVLVASSAQVMRLLLVIEGAGIALLLLLFGSVLMQTHTVTAPHIVAVSAHDGLSGLFAAVVVAFLSWAGFESSLSLASETRNPRRDIPRSLYGSVLITALLFIIVSWAIETGFSERLGGRPALVETQNALGALGGAYLGKWCSVGFGFAALGSSFACTVAAITSVTHLLTSLYPSRFAAGRGTTLMVGTCVAATQLIIPHVTIFGGSPVASYGTIASCGAVCVMVAYQCVQFGFINALFTKKIDGHLAEILIPAATTIVICLVLMTGLLQRGAQAVITVAGLGWCAVALAISLYETKRPSFPFSQDASRS